MKRRRHRYFKTPRPSRKHRPEVKTKVLDDKLAKRQAGLKIETFFTALSEIRDKVLIDTLAGEPADMEIETLHETVSQRYAGVLLENWLMG